MGCHSPEIQRNSHNTAEQPRSNGEDKLGAGKHQQDNFVSVVSLDFIYTLAYCLIEHFTAK